MRNSVLSWQYKDTEKSRCINRWQINAKFDIVFPVTDLQDAINLINRLDFFS